ncbi:hypothetical protein TNCV_2162261 [Trichonephila clavipes]|nr:hypothetical protein TNCV_2162261 [Trichonephila clavipes]
MEETKSSHLYGILSLTGSPKCPISDPGKVMDACKCRVSVRYVITLNIQLVESPREWLIDPRTTPVMLTPQIGVKRSKIALSDLVSSSNITVLFQHLEGIEVSIDHLLDLPSYSKRMRRGLPESYLIPERRKRKISMGCDTFLM